ncbi:MAG: nucleotidyl transferase AbiEii/AbiGii toxin family protein [Treponema sp.]|nr:nucleotidyl transferase AbiEii/AbiGii toxin family protein [Treponema sp.]
MKTKNAMQLKALIKNKSKEVNISPQLLLQNYYMECFIDRLSRSEYADRFIIKGGFLISSLVGLNNRSTMDIDTTVKNLSVNESEISKIISHICSVPADDDFTFIFDHVEPIREDDEYQGLRAFLFADYEAMRGTLTMDITTGDSIYPNVSRRKITRCFDTDVIDIFSYPLETVLAEKIETIITRGILNTRPRDFYDVYILTKTQGYNAETLRKAIFATAEHRGTKAIMEAETNNRLAVIENSSELQSQWAKYQKKFLYAKDITYQETVNAVKEVIHEIYI